MSSIGDFRFLGPVFIFVVAMVTEVAGQLDCDKVFSSYTLKNKMGVFQSPGFPSNYPNGVKCKYKFIANSNERVKIRFTQFSLQGRPPNCYDYIEIYSQLQKETENLLEAGMTGPFCGEGKDNLPKMVVSTKNILILWFYSNHEKSSSGFNGTWEFIDAVPYEMGTVASNICDYVIRYETKSKGHVISPTYPGVYPDNSICFYKFQGKPGQRIKLVFEDFSLFYGGDYCPFDYLRIYDGLSKESQEIGKFCGSYNSSTVIFSSTETLKMEFVTGEGRLNFAEPSMDVRADFKFERRGFNISYEFSDSFVRLDSNYILNGSEHILGTECDLRIMSYKESHGTIVSPGYPGDARGVVCHYYLDGLMDDQNLEKVKISFTNFNIPGNIPYCLLGYLVEVEDLRLNEGSGRGRYCGTINPPTIYSQMPRMVLVFNISKEIVGKFTASYQFITDYGIKGEQIEEGKCKFHYKSHMVKFGEVNSPRHPGNYPANLDCEYIFRPFHDEVVVISFSVFNVSGHDIPNCITGDYVAFYEDLGTVSRENFTLTEKYCGKALPGPYATTKLLKMVFHSDDHLGHLGFKANYRFLHKKNISASCPELDSYSGDRVIYSGGKGGTIESPGFPSKYSKLSWCDWVIRASRIENKILVEIAELNLEGIYSRGTERASCEVAVLRLYNDSNSVRPVASTCGIKKSTESSPSYLSSHNTFKITFLSSSSSLGAKGFKISWTEVHTGHSISEHSGGDCAGFQCTTNKYCISPSLKCNKEPNCGQGDNSDETAECSSKMGPKSSGIQILHIAIGTSISSFFCIILIICGFYHRRKFRSDRAPPDHDHVEVRYVSAPTGCNTTDRLLMEDRNDGSNDHHNHSTTQSPRCQKVSMV
ncbi:cubilin-like isoform X3 [Biomphalaria glabrata]|uniref:Cubilin-like isoform X3 n=1 Tax=Biomphalaria glabrata TaxID=6526 RepID=A0A9W3ARN3_BIOGL|nr:cubilin-like isoform X3 [Biomphalaria glabrata]